MQKEELKDSKKDTKQKRKPCAKQQSSSFINLIKVIAHLYQMGYTCEE